MKLCLKKLAYQQQLAQMQLAYPYNFYGFRIKYLVIYLKNRINQRGQMFTARITRKVLVGMNGYEDRVFKNEMIDTNLPSLLTKML